ncbi:glycosyltransferase family 2 protein [Synechococcus sp. J7-Johnson]|uniref:glycosyltransferase family 2 protein n=1 Tax=Synechococcus sp. J7-Johnson TaxID=2823737 RepID=UPI0020CBF94E|nr:glycosyltransferase family 2 protein [Synechococcus sp. J7-Johnson]MCP9842083.1 glycosyltransferase family 2 protein [Synechococcus sp. J7-Johnson]
MAYSVDILIPCFNEEACLPSLFSTLQATLRIQVNINWTLIIINDGSRDGTSNLALRLLKENEHWCRGKLIDLSRNFGKEAALIAGLDHSNGQATIIMDADLQDPPELIELMIKAWIDGAEVVNASRTDRGTDGILKILTASLFYRIFRLTSRLDIKFDVSDFRLLDHAVVSSITQCRETVRFSKGFFAWAGFQQHEIPYSRPDRVSGSGKWSYWKLWNYALDGIFSFSTAPLRIWTYAGLVITLIAFYFGVLTLFRTLILGIQLPGYSSIFTAVTFLGGAQLIGIGVLGEYLGRTYMESKRRPPYIIRKINET